MKRIAKAATLTIASGALVLGGAGAAGAVAPQLLGPDAGAIGGAAGSPGVVSGNSVQIPIGIPINFCGNTIDIIGLLNPAAGNACVNV